MKIEMKAFLPTFVFGIIYGMHHFLKSFIVWWAHFSLDSVSDVVVLIWFSNQVSAVIDWVLLFIVLIVMYYVGKKLDLKANLKWIIISMLVGCFTGYFIVRLVSMPLFFIIAQQEISPNLAVNYLVGNLYTSLETTSSLFLTSFTAIAVAHLRKTG